MHAEVIAIGDELTSGERLDTNSQWLSQQLVQLGIPVSHHTTVGDDQAAIVAVLAEACRRSDVVVISGGLGPTADDLTRQAMADMTGRPLVEDPRSLRHIRALFRVRGRVMPEQNTIQAHFPEGSQPIANPHGTAPGIALTMDRANGTSVSFFALPGVPAELKEMWHATVAPALVARCGTSRRVIRQRVIRCFGAGESEIESRLPDLVRRGREPLVGITASQATITLRVVAEGADVAECEAKLTPTVATIYSCLGPLIYGEGEMELADAVVQHLTERSQTLATVEWGTAGLMASWLGDVPASAACWRGGLIVRDRESLSRVLGVLVEGGDGLPIDAQPLVAQMAAAGRERCGSDYGLAIGPFPEGAVSLAGRVHVAVAGRGQLVSESFVFAAHPAIQRDRCAKQALNFLRLTLAERCV
jgi:nicotinamide-nucleotide amidase